MRSRLSLQRAGSWAFGAIVLLIGALVVQSFAMNAAAEDLHGQALIARGFLPETPRTPVSMWLSARIAPDLASNDASGLDQRAQDIDHRADRIRELAGATSVAGLVLGLATARPERRLASDASDASPLASTNSNGTV
jgi:hypothetical protein